MVDNNSIDSYDAVSDWFANLPELAEVKWTSDHLSPTNFWTGSYIDIHIPKLEEVVPINWTVTIVEQSNEEAIWDLEWPTDVTVWAVWNPNPPTYWYENEIAVLKGEELEAGQLHNLKKYANSVKNGEVTSYDGWTHAAVTAAIASWAAQEFNRLDLRFVWDPFAGPSPMLSHALDIAAKVKSGEVNPTSWAETKQKLGLDCE